MELDDFKNIRPDNGHDQKKRATHNEKNQAMESLITELKTKDARERKRMTVFIVVYFALIAVYSGNFSFHRGGVLGGYGLLILGFGLAIIYFFFKSRAFRTTDYISDSLEFLKKAEKRYRYMTPADWLVVVVLLIIIVSGGALVVYYSFTKYIANPMIAVVIYGIVMAAAITIGLISGKKLWEKEKGEIYEMIREMIREFEA